MSQARALSAEEIRGLRDELAGGGTPTVWFTAAAVGVPEGRSGKVIAMDEPAEGDFIQVRPAGSKDVLSFSAGEVTLVKPPRKRKEPAGAKDSAPARSTGGAAASSGGSASSGSTGGSAGTGRSGSGAGSSGNSGGSAGSGGAAAAGSGRGTSGANRSTSAAAKPAGSTGTGASAKNAAEPQRTGTTRRKPRSPAGATVVLTADEAGQWTCEVSTGKKRLLKPTPVSPAAVSQATRSLHADVAAAVEPLLDAAREQQRERVERLQRELADAQRMLDELTD